MKNSLDPARCAAAIHKREATRWLAQQGPGGEWFVTNMVTVLAAPDKATAEKVARAKNKADAAKSPAAHGDVVEQMMAYENGELDHDETIELFQQLVDSGMIEQLPGHYQRVANQMIEAGVLTPPIEKDPAETALASPGSDGVGGRRIGPYMGVELDRIATYATPDGPRRFRIIVYRAYNAMGLIGSESNGIAVFDDDAREVVADEIAKQSSGFYGASKQQLALADQLVGMEWEEFREFVNSQTRLRYSL